MTDLIIIGSGIAGVSASIYAQNKGLKVILFDGKMFGGALNYINKITNYPGFNKVSGSELAFKLYEQVKSNNIDFKNEMVKSINKMTNGFSVITTKETYVTKNIIIATGRKPRLLGLDNETELIGHGISYCAICDGPLYKDLDVCVVGGGNKAIHEAEYLSNICHHVYLIHRRDCFKADDKLVLQLKEHNNVSFIMNEEVKKIEKSEDYLIIALNNQKLNVSGVFIAIGYVPNTSFIDDLGIDNDHDYIVVDNHYETNIKGIYAAGDCIKKDIYQLITAASEGISAVLNIKQ